MARPRREGESAITLGGVPGATAERPLALQPDHQGTQGQRVRENGDTMDTEHPPVSLPTDPVFTGQNNFGDTGDSSHPVGVTEAVKA
jgi:hypothetical protein